MNTRKYGDYRILWLLYNFKGASSATNANISLSDYYIGSVWKLVEADSQCTLYILCIYYDFDHLIPYLLHLSKQFIQNISNTFLVLFKAPPDFQLFADVTISLKFLEQQLYIVKSSVSVTRDLKKLSTKPERFNIGTSEQPLFGTKNFHSV